MIKLFSGAVVAAVLMAAASAHAEPQKVVVVTGTIAYREAQLATPAGAARLLGRIDAMARRLCASSFQTIPHPDDQSRACRHQAVARAVDTLAAPLVTAAYADRHPLSIASR